MIKGPDYYATLGVLPTIEPDALTAVYRALVKKYHPDVYAGGRDDAERITKEINEAYAVLRDPAKRADYDGVVIVPTTSEHDIRARRRVKEPWRFGPLRAAILAGSLVALGGLGFTVWKETRTSAPVQISDADSLVAIPTVFVGRWARDSYACHSRADASRVSISATAIAYDGFAPIEVRSVQRVTDKEVIVSVLPEPGPQRESTRGRWRVSSDQNGLMIDWGDAPPEILHRCTK